LSFYDKISFLDLISSACLYFFASFTFLCLTLRYFPLHFVLFCFSSLVQQFAYSFWHLQPGFRINWYLPLLFEFDTSLNLLHTAFSIFCFVLYSFEIYNVVPLFNCFTASYCYHAMLFFTALNCAVISSSILTCVSTDTICDWSVDNMFNLNSSSTLTCVSTDTMCDLNSSSTLTCVSTDSLCDWRS
jgi:hypothetical protein